MRNPRLISLRVQRDGHTRCSPNELYAEGIKGALDGSALCEEGKVGQVSAFKEMCGVRFPTDIKFECCALNESVKIAYAFYNKSNTPVLLKWECPCPFGVRPETMQLQPEQQGTFYFSFSPKSIALFEALIRCHIYKHKSTTTSTAVDCGIDTGSIAQAKTLLPHQGASKAFRLRETLAHEIACVEVSVNGTGSVPYVVFGNATTSLNFGPVRVGQRKQKIVVLENLSDVKTSFHVSLNNKGPERKEMISNVFSVFPTTGTLLPKKKSHIKVLCHSRASNPVNAAVFKVETASGALNYINCTAELPKIEAALTDSKIDFGEVRLGETVLKSFYLKNCGTAKTVYQIIEGESSFCRMRNCQGTLLPDTSLKFDVSFQPTFHSCWVTNVVVLVKGAVAPLGLHLAGRVEGFATEINDHFSSPNQIENDGYAYQNDHNFTPFLIQLDNSSTAKLFVESSKITAPGTRQSERTTKTFTQDDACLELSLKNCHNEKSAIEPSHLCFGVASPFVFSSRQILTVRNDSEATRTCVWTIQNYADMTRPSSEDFLVVPNRKDILPKDSEQFEVIFQPNVIGNFNWCVLKAILHPKGNEHKSTENSQHSFGPKISRCFVYAETHPQNSGPRLMQADISNNSIQFSPCTPGKSCYHVLQITNKSRRSGVFRILNFKSQTFIEEARASTNRTAHFSAWPKIGILAPNDFQLVLLQFTVGAKEERTKYYGEFEIEFNFDQTQRSKILLRGNSCDPVVSVESFMRPLTIPTTWMNQRIDSFFNLTNESPLPVCFNCFVSPSQKAVCRIPTTSGTLNPLAKVRVDFSFLPSEKGFYTIPIQVQYDADAAVADVKPRIQQLVYLEGSCVEAPIEIMPAKLHLGCISPYQIRTGEINLYNPTGLDVAYRIHDIEIIRQEKENGAVRFAEVSQTSFGKPGERQDFYRRIVTGERDIFLALSKVNGVLCSQKKDSINLTLVSRIPGNLRFILKIEICPSVGAATKRESRLSGGKLQSFKSSIFEEESTVQYGGSTFQSRKNKHLEVAVRRCFTENELLEGKIESNRRSEGFVSITHAVAEVSTPRIQFKGLYLSGQYNIDCRKQHAQAMENLSWYFSQEASAAERCFSSPFKKSRAKVDGYKSIELLDLDLGVHTKAETSFKINFCIENLGHCPSKIKFYDWRDLALQDIELYENADQMKEVQRSSKPFNFTAKSCIVEPGKPAVITLQCSRKQEGCYRFSMLLVIQYGRCLRIDAHSIIHSSDMPVLSVPNLKIMTPVRVGSRYGPCQSLELRNESTKPLYWKFNEETMLSIKSQSSEDNHFMPSQHEGTICPHSSSYIHISFLPKAVKKHVCCLGFVAQIGMDVQECGKQSTRQLQYSTILEGHGVSTEQRRKPKYEDCPGYLPNAFREGEAQLGGLTPSSIHLHDIEKDSLRRVVVVRNNTKDSILSFVWETRHLFGDGETCRVEIDPPSGILYPGTRRLVKFKFQLIKAVHLDGEIVCFLAEETKPLGVEANFYRAEVGRKQDMREPDHGTTPGLQKLVTRSENATGSVPLYLRVILDASHHQVISKRPISHWKREVSSWRSHRDHGPPFQRNSASQITLHQCSRFIDAFNELTHEIVSGFFHDSITKLQLNCQRRGNLLNHEIVFEASLGLGNHIPTSESAPQSAFSQGQHDRHRVADRASRNRMPPLNTLRRAVNDKPETDQLLIQNKAYPPRVKINSTKPESSSSFDYQQNSQCATTNARAMHNIPTTYEVITSLNSFGTALSDMLYSFASNILSEHASGSLKFFHC